MTEKIFFDTDCLSAFLWIREESILTKLYPGRIILPAQVYEELQRVPHLQARVDKIRNRGELKVETMEVGSEEYRDYVKMTVSPDKGIRIIGRGEAAGIAMAKNRNGVLASNNMRDVRLYVEKYRIAHITTGDILIEAMEAGMITENDGNQIWADMIQKRRSLPTGSFSEYLKKNRNMLRSDLKEVKEESQYTEKDLGDER